MNNEASGNQLTSGKEPKYENHFFRNIGCNIFPSAILQVQDMYGSKKARRQELKKKIVFAHKQ
jgi:hypothetical protein